MKDKLQRVNFEAFAAASALARTLRPKGSASPLASGYSSAIQQLFDATTEVLSDNSVDGEVRERALETLGNLFVHEGDALTKSYTVGLPLIAARLGTESTAATALKVIGRVADSPVCKGKEFENWLLSTLPEMVTALRKSRRTSSRNAEFNCLQSVLRRIGSQKTLPADLANSLVVELKTFVDSPLALSSISLILEFQPSSRAAVEADVLPQVLASIKTSSLNSTSVDSIVRFFPAYVAGQNDKSVQKVVAALVDNLGHKNALPDTTKGAALGYSATAQSIGAMAAACPGSAAGIVTKFASTLKVSEVLGWVLVADA
jgi:cullin-associated NEDD8-dissociated protein 1